MICDWRANILELELSRVELDANLAACDAQAHAATRAEAQSFEPWTANAFFVALDGYPHMPKYRARPKGQNTELLLFFTGRTLHAMSPEADCRPGETSEAAGRITNGAPAH